MMEMEKRPRTATKGPHPDHAEQKKRVRRIRGQIEGIDKMIDERRYCIDILHQVKAARSALQALEAEILKVHLRHCVRSVFRAKDAMDVEKKIQEIADIF